MLWCRISCNRRIGKEAVLYSIWFEMNSSFVVAHWKLTLLRPSINKYHLSELQNCGSERWLGSLASRMLVMDLGNFFCFVSSSFTFWGMKCPVYIVIVKSLPLQNRVVNTVLNCFKIHLNVSYKGILFSLSSSFSLMGLSIVALVKKKKKKRERLQLLVLFWLLSSSSQVISLDLNLIHSLEEIWFFFFYSLSLHNRS